MRIANKAWNQFAIVHVQPNGARLDQRGENDRFLHSQQVVDKFWYKASVYIVAPHPLEVMRFSTIPAT